MASPVPTALLRFVQLFSRRFRLNHAVICAELRASGSRFEQDSTATPMPCETIERMSRRPRNTPPPHPRWHARAGGRGTAANAHCTSVFQSGRKWFLYKSQGFETTVPSCFSKNARFSSNSLCTRFFAKIAIPCGIRETDCVGDVSILCVSLLVNPDPSSF